MPDAVRYGITDLKGVGESAFEAIVAGRPYTSFDDFLARRGAKCDSGSIDKLVLAGAFDSLEPNRNALIQRWEWIKREQSDNLCQWLDESYNGPGGLPCRRDWSDVPVELKRDGSPKKTQKGPPKRCTRGCWKYEPREQPDYSLVPPFSPADLREIEMDLFGVYLSSTPFGDLDQADVRACATGADLDGLAPGEEGLVCVQLVSHSRKADRNNNMMGFLNLLTHDGYKLKVVAFHKTWKRIQGDIYDKRLFWGVVQKTDRGWHIVGLRPA